MRLVNWIGWASLWMGATLLLSAAENVPTVRFGLMPGVPPVLESDAQKNDSETPVVARLDYFREGDDFLIKTTAAITGAEAWVKVVHEWVEPITAPDGTAPTVAPEQMMLVEVQGKVTLEEPNKEPVAVSNGQELPVGATLVTGPDATVAVFIGGINSVRLGPETRVSITYQVVGPFRLPGSTKSMQRRITRVQLDSGKVFSKIGYDAQVEQYFQITTDMGSAVAASGDFLTIKSANTLEFGVARGAVRIVDAKSQEIATMTVNNQSGFQILRLPEAKSHLAIMTANSRFLETTMSMISQINQKVEALRKRHESGVNMTTQEREYMDRLPTMTFLQRVRKL